MTVTATAKRRRKQAKMRKGRKIQKHERYAMRLALMKGKK